MAPTLLEIKTNALGRLVKEEGLYQQELKAQEKVIENLKKENADEYDIKKQVEVLQDTKNVIPQVQAKVKESLELLEKYLETYTGEEDTSIAKQSIDSANSLLRSLA